MAGDKGLAWLTGEYERLLRAVLRRQPLVLAITIGTFFLTVYLLHDRAQGISFRSRIRGGSRRQIRGQQDISFDALKTKAEADRQHRAAGAGDRKHDDVYGRRRAWGRRGLQLGEHVSGADAE